jgi:hypothetical protein
MNNVTAVLPYVFFAPIAVGAALSLAYWFMIVGRVMRKGLACWALRAAERVLGSPIVIRWASSDVGARVFSRTQTSIRSQVHLS